MHEARPNVSNLESETLMTEGEGFIASPEVYDNQLPKSEKIYLSQKKSKENSGVACRRPLKTLPTLTRRTREPVNKLIDTNL